MVTIYIYLLSLLVLRDGVVSAYKLVKGNMGHVPGVPAIVVPMNTTFPTIHNIKNYLARVDSPLLITGIT